MEEVLREVLRWYIILGGVVTLVLFVADRLDNHNSSFPLSIMGSVGCAVLVGLLWFPALLILLWIIWAFSGTEESQ
jgi:NADH:ubiquinone oxidoreductase subunit 6 (subunit J)